MIGLLLLAGSIALVDSYPTGREAAELPRRVLVFGIDGGTWNVMKPMFEAGELPNLRQLVRRGIHGVLQSRPPVLSPVVWTTIFTGHSHEEHGVDSWKTSQSKNRKVKALWNITSQRGLTTHVFNVPGTWPPEAVRGVMLSGFPLSGSTVGGGTGIVVTEDDLDRRTLPQAIRANARLLRKRMRSLAVDQWSRWLSLPLRGRPGWRGEMRIKRLSNSSFYLSPWYRVDPGLVVSYPPGARMSISRALRRPYIPEGPGWSKHAEPETPGYLYEHLRQVSRIQTDAVSLFAAKPWSLLLYVDTLVDRVSHPYWAYMRPSDYDGLDQDKAARYADVVREAYRETDRQLGEVLEQARGEFYVVIVSDHGFKSSRNKTLYIGTHDFDGIYLIAGPGLGGIEGRRAYIEDIAPSILYLLGLPLAGDFQGRVLPELLASLKRPLERIASYEDGSVRRATRQPIDRKSWEQLRSLGYVGGARPHPPARP